MKYTKEQKDFLIKNNYMKSARELANMFNKEFNTNITHTNIKNFRGNNHLNSGLTGRFEKGHKPYNKGKKWDYYMSKDAQDESRKTCFKKGNVPKNYRPVGSERLNKDGFIEIKISDPNKWQLKHRYLWEKKYGKIPKGYKLIFLDGNAQNLEFDNLKLVSNLEELTMNRYKLRHNDKNLTEVGLTIAKIINKQGKLKNERNRL